LQLLFNYLILKCFRLLINWVLIFWRFTLSGKRLLSFNFFWIFFVRDTFLWYIFESARHLLVILCNILLGLATWLSGAALHKRCRILCNWSRCWARWIFNKFYLFNRFIFCIKKCFLKIRSWLISSKKHCEKTYDFCYILRPLF